MTKKIMDQLTSYEVVSFIKAHYAEIEQGGTDEYWTSRINDEADITTEITVHNYRGTCRRLEVKRNNPLADYEKMEKKIRRIAICLSGLYAECGQPIPQELRAIQE
jgi:hypothetical protein